MIRVESLKYVSRETSKLGRISLVRLLRQRVKLSNGVIKCLFGEVACAIGAVENLVARRCVSLV